MKKINGKKVNCDGDEVMDPIQLLIGYIPDGISGI